MWDTYHPLPTFPKVSYQTFFINLFRKARKIGSLWIYSEEESAEGQLPSLCQTYQENRMTTEKLRKVAPEMGRPAIIEALRRKAALMSKDKGKERALPNW